MNAGVELVLLKCTRCGTPVPAEDDEVAWLCATCGQGLGLTADGLAPIDLHWALARPGARVAQWLAFWVFEGTVTFGQRENYGGRSQPDNLWHEPRRFYVPAYNCTLQHLEALGADLTRKQVVLSAGQPAGAVRGCTLLPDDARPAVEFVVLTIEADRKDKLRAIAFALQLSPAQLWLLPFGEGEPSLKQLCV